MMNNRELFHKDPLSWTLANEGVSSNNDNDFPTLRYELETFVCDGEYRTGLVKMLQGYLNRLDQEQAGAWVSGFYGSGKSHLVKVLRYVWTDFALPNGSTARGVTTLPEEVAELLKELSTRGKQGAGLHAAGGTLKAGKGDIRTRVLGIVFRSVGLPEDVSIASLMLDLRDDGTLAAIESKIQSFGKDPLTEFSRMYTSKEFLEAYLDQYPHHQDVKAAAAAVRAQYPPKPGEMSIDGMLTQIRRAISRDGKLPCTVLVLDEIQQFINNDPNVTADFQEVAEAIQKQLDGKVFLVATGQSALSDTPALQRIMGRFSIKVHLKDNDVEKVVRTVVLRKDPTKRSEIESIINKHSGEISRQLKATKIATRTEDQDSYVADYPLLPVRRRFWERVLHSTDPTGTAAQMRTQLRVTHEACRSVANQPVGTVIPADFLYEQLSTDLVISGEMQKRFQEIIEEQKTKLDGELRARICSLVFLINKLPREGADAGIRANEEHLADLLSDDLSSSAAKLRSEIPGLMKSLTDEGVLMAIDGEYRLQTTEGAAWDTEFRKRFASARNNDSQIAAQRGQLISRAVQSELSSLIVQHGAAKEKRKVTLHHDVSPPSNADGLVIWIRDGFTEAESAVVQDIQKRSTEDATVHVLIPKAKADELKSAIAGALAADETLNFKGNPTTPEGKEARASMLSRKAMEDAKVAECVTEIFKGARLFLSGGQELAVITLKEAAQQACEQVLSRLFPKFSIADSANWHLVWKKAKEGNSGALTAVNYAGDPDKHPVSSELIRYIGAGKKGSEIYSNFTGGSYGWPKESLDAILATLLVSGHLGARINQQPAALADLDQKKITQADYRVKNPVLTAAQKLRIRKLYQHANHPFMPGDELAAAAGLVALLHELAQSAGGDPPAPEKPHSSLVIDLAGMSGDDLLHRIYSEADVLTELITQWKDLTKRIGERKDDFILCDRLLHFATKAHIPDATSQAEALDAIRKSRLLLDEPNPIDPVRHTLAQALRKSLHDAHAQHEDRLASETGLLATHPVWSALSDEAATNLLKSAGAVSQPAPLTGTDAELLISLQHRDLAGWQTLTDAIPARCQQALNIAITDAMPKAKRVQLPSATISNTAELDAWLAETRAAIETTLKEGPAIV
jgi:hypothetical protein